MNFRLLAAILLLVGLAVGFLFLTKGSLSFAPAVRPTEVVELKDGETYALTAAYVTKTLAGKEQKMLAYNGSIPGPTIRVPQGATVTIDFKNDTDLPAALHSHGVRMENAFDGAPPITQKEIPPRGSFIYKLRFPDTGVFWYHPHVAEVYEQPLGLYGAFVVAPEYADYYPPVNREEILFLSDIPIENGKITLMKDTEDHSLMGHYGNVFLVNGEENFSLEAKAGEVARFSFVNAANARPFNIVIPGTRMKLVGGDNGGYENASWQSEITLGPSERAIVDVLLPGEGKYELQNKTPLGTHALGEITVGAEHADPSYVRAFGELQENAAVGMSIKPFRKYFDRAPDKKLVLTVDMAGNMSEMHGAHMMPDGSMMGGSMMLASPGGIEWEDTSGMMNSLSTTDSTKWHIVDAATGKKDMDIDWTFPQGMPVMIQIYNDPRSMHPMQHPIHFHGQRFLVVARNGVREENLVWKDTVLVKSGETVDILLDSSNPGVWMAHCHISEHLQAGMMFAFKVEGFAAGSWLETKQ